MPLDIKDYFFTDISIKANREYFDAAEAGRGIERLEFEDLDYIIDQSETDGRLVMHLALFTREDQENRLPYTLRIEIIGTFSTGFESQPDDATYSLVLSSAAALLYGAARDRVASVTNLMPFGVIFLPMQSFLFGREEGEEA